MALQEPVTRGGLLLYPLSNLPVTPKGTKRVGRRENSKNSLQTFITCEHCYISQSLPPDFWQHPANSCPTWPHLERDAQESFKCFQSRWFPPSDLCSYAGRDKSRSQSCTQSWRLGAKLRYRYLVGRRNMTAPPCSEQPVKVFGYLVKMFLVRCSGHVQMKETMRQAQQMLDWLQLPSSLGFVPREAGGLLTKTEQLSAAPPQSLSPWHTSPQSVKKHHTAEG